MSPPLSLPRVAVGTMNFGGRTPAVEAERIVRRALERGGPVLFDTANLYEGGKSETILGKALGSDAHALVATKVGLLPRGGKPEGLSPERIREALNESLTRLGRDHVDVYYLHAPDSETPMEATLDALAELHEAGRFRAWGMSNFASWQLLEWQIAAARRGMPGPLVSQVVYNLLVRQLDVEYFAFAKAHPIHTTVFNPLAGGVLARAPEAKGARMKSPIYRRRYGSPDLAGRVERYRELAAETNLPLATLAYAWTAQRPGVDSVLVGPGTVEHLDAAFEGVETTLPAEVLARIEALHVEFQGTDARYARC